MSISVYQLTIFSGLPFLSAAESHILPPESVAVAAEVFGKEHTWVGGSRTGVFSKEDTELGLAELPGP